MRLDNFVFLSVLVVAQISIGLSINHESGVIHEKQKDVPVLIELFEKNSQSARRLLGELRFKLRRESLTNRCLSYYQELTNVNGKQNDPVTDIRSLPLNWGQQIKDILKNNFDSSLQRDLDDCVDLWTSMSSSAKSISPENERYSDDEIQKLKRQNDDHNQKVARLEPTIIDTDSLKTENLNLRKDLDQLNKELTKYESDHKRESEIMQKLQSEIERLTISERQSRDEKSQCEDTIGKIKSKYDQERVELLKSIDDHSVCGKEQLEKSESLRSSNEELRTENENLKAHLSQESDKNNNLHKDLDELRQQLSEYQSDLKNERSIMQVLQSEVDRLEMIELQARDEKSKYEITLKEMESKCNQERDELLKSINEHSVCSKEQLEKSESLKRSNGELQSQNEQLKGNLVQESDRNGKLLARLDELKELYENERNRFNQLEKMANKNKEIQIKLREKLTEGEFRVHEEKSKCDSLIKEIQEKSIRRCDNLNQSINDRGGAETKLSALQQLEILQKRKQENAQQLEKYTELIGRSQEDLKRIDNLHECKKRLRDIENELDVCRDEKSSAISTTSDLLNKIHTLESQINQLKVFKITCEAQRTEIEHERDQCSRKLEKLSHELQKEQRINEERFNHMNEPIDGPVESLNQFQYQQATQDRPRYDSLGYGQPVRVLRYY